MKSRVKATGKIIEVIPYNRDGFAYIQDDGETVYEFHELEILDDPDYWTRLEHQYAGMAMQGMLSGWWSESIAKIAKSDGEHFDIIVHKANDFAHALVEKYKKEEK